MTKTLKDALQVANSYWAGRGGAKVMGSVAAKCCDLVGMSSDIARIKAEHGVALLADLRDYLRLSPKSVQDYYNTFKRLLAINGVDTSSWPKAPTPPRVKSREPMTGEGLDGLINWFREKGYDTTADLAVLLRATGLRVDKEALTDANLEVTVGDTYDTLRVIGKGGHERFIPVVDPAGRALLASSDRLGEMRGVPHRTHLKRWVKGVSTLGITTKLATPHAVRHMYATETYRKSGGDLVMVQELLGHADPATTARYLQVDLGAKARALAIGIGSMIDKA